MLCKGKLNIFLGKLCSLPTSAAGRVVSEDFIPHWVLSSLEK